MVVGAGDPKRDIILSCQRIHQRILARTCSLVMSIDSGGDEGLSMDEEEEVGAEAEEEVVGLVSRSDSRTGMPTDFIDGVSSAVAVHTGNIVIPTAAAGSDCISAISLATGSSSGGHKT